MIVSFYQFLNVLWIFLLWHNLFSVHILLALRSLGRPHLAGLCSMVWKTNCHRNTTGKGGCFPSAIQCVFVGNPGLNHTPHLLCCYGTVFLNDWPIYEKYYTIQLREIYHICLPGHHIQKANVCNLEQDTGQIQLPIEQMLHLICITNNKG